VTAQIPTETSTGAAVATNGNGARGGGGAIGGSVRRSGGASGITGRSWA
jgi:hypothetical protein